MVLLSIIYNKKKTYGYEIISILNEFGGHIFENSKVGTIYPLLYRMVDDDLIVIKNSIGEEKTIRKFYCITPKGEQELKIMMNIWSDLVTQVDILKRI